MRQPLPDAPKVLMVAPFARGREFGGSQRATAMAERLEARGCAITWLHVERTPMTRRERVLALLRREPELLSRHSRTPRLPQGDWSAVIAVHSYMAPFLDLAGPDRPRVLDFVDLEWQRLRDFSALCRFPQKLFQRVQSRFMHRYESDALRRFPTFTFCNDAEREWAADRSDARCLLIPNILPAKPTEAALAIAVSRRERDPGARRVLYVGKLTHGPNLRALARFVADVWPRVRERFPEAELVVIGDCAPEDRRQLEREPRVSCLGFVEDLEPLLRDATVGVLPLETQVGTSLRILFYALAEVPLIGSPQAFRGFDRSMGAAAHTTEEWVDWIVAALSNDTRSPAMLRSASANAQTLQQSPAPWDQLAAAITDDAAALAPGSSRQGDEIAG